MKWWGLEKRPEFNAIQLAAILARKAPDASPYVVALDAAKLYGLSRQIAALAVVDCNSGMTVRQERRREKMMELVATIAGWYDLSSMCSGDPRGYVVRVFGEGVPGNSGWGEGYGIA